MDYATREILLMGAGVLAFGVALLWLEVRQGETGKESQKIRRSSIVRIRKVPRQKKSRLR